MTGAGRSGEAQRPNFLFITTDQQRSDHLGCYGNPLLRTPAIDGIAARGLAFDNFFVACPICMPNRASILTGRMPSVSRSRHNGIPLALDAVTFVDLLRVNGYHTGLVGKSHLQTITGQPIGRRDLFARELVGDRPPAPYDDAHKSKREGSEYETELLQLWHDNPDRNAPELPYYGFDYVRFANGHSDHVQGHYTGWLAARTPNPDAFRGPANALPSPGLTAPQAWRTAMPEELYPTTYIGEAAAEFIDRHLDERPRDPFFVHCSFTDPHHPFTPPGKYFDMYDPDDIALPVSFDRIDPNEPDMLSRLRQELQSGSARMDEPLPFCVRAEEARQIIALTYGMISMVDDAVARLLAHLDRRGLAESTVVIFTSDHGDFMGDHGLMLKHGLHYDGVLRVPFIWSDPCRIESGRTAVEASSIDIGASILARAGLAPNNGNQGTDVMALTADSAAFQREGILIEEDELGDHLGTDEGLRTRTFIRDGWRLSLWQGMDGGQLYNLNDDPHELRNLWFDRDYAAERASLTEAMLREMIRLGDTTPYAMHVA